MTIKKVFMRKKGKYADGSSKYILEGKEDNSPLETRTVPRPEILWEMLRPDDSVKKQSQHHTGKIKKPSEKFVYEIINEQQRADAKKQITDEELKKLWELTK